MKDRGIPFRKMNGLGNEFLVFDARRAPVELSPIAIRELGAADEIADFGSAQTTLTARVTQLSATVGAGFSTTATLTP